MNSIKTLQSTVQFTALQDGIYAFGKAHLSAVVPTLPLEQCTLSVTKLLLDEQSGFKNSRKRIVHPCGIKDKFVLEGLNESK